ncbi:MAG: hypothetical protein ABJ370_21855 [Paracoccaceae bacterium]
MKQAAVILGIIGGLLGMLTGFFVLGYVEFVSWFDTQVEQNLLVGPTNAQRLQIIGVVAPVLAIAGGAMAFPRPALGAVCLMASTIGMIWAFGIGVFTMFPIVMTGLATVFALIGFAAKEPGTI